MSIPAIFLAFANDEDRHLSLLEEERKTIQEYLLPLAKQNFFQLYAESHSTFNDIEKYLIELKNSIAIFHFGGHSDSQTFSLTDQEIYGTGIGQQLALQENLKLVFLNGCANQNQVAAFFELGIPAIIATSVNIADSKAKDFASTFYYGLSCSYSIEEAFTLAASNYLAKTGDQLNIHRGIGSDRYLPSKNQLPWGLYIREGQEAILNYKLPMRNSSSIVLENARKHFDPNYSINASLIQLLYEAVEGYSEAIATLTFRTQRKNSKPSPRDLKNAIINSFPTPIGEHIRKLFIIEEISIRRLKQTIRVYTVAVELLTFSLLCHLWDAKHQNPNLVIPAEHSKAIHSFLSMSQEGKNGFSYLGFISLLGDIFIINELLPFVVEFIDLHKEFHTQGHFYQICQSLDHLRQYQENVISANEIESLCIQAEELLGAFLKKTNFSVQYILTTIKNIEVNKKRFTAPTYKHNLVFLDRVEAATGVLDEPRDFKKFAENQSVILLREETNVQPFLNLSPFVIDENALLQEQNSKLFFFCYTQDGNYHYKLVNNLKDELVVSNTQYRHLKEQFDDFRRALLGGNFIIK